MVKFIGIEGVLAHLNLRYHAEHALWYIFKARASVASSKDGQSITMHP